MNGLYEKLLEEKVVVLDIETTGLRCGEEGADRILEIAAVKLEKLQKTETFHRYIACPEPLPEEVALLTGISDEMLAGAPPLAQVLKEFAVFSEGAVLAAYHLPFDCQFLDYYGVKCGISFSQERVDLLPLVRRILGEELKDLRVSSVAEAMGEEDAPKTCEETAEAFAKWLPQFAVREKEKEG